MYCAVPTDQKAPSLNVSRLMEDCRRLADDLGWKVTEDDMTMISAYGGSTGRTRSGCWSTSRGPSNGVARLSPEAAGPATLGVGAVGHPAHHREHPGPGLSGLRLGRRASATTVRLCPSTAGRFLGLLVKSP